MNRPTLKNILQSAYDRNQWISTLQFLTGKRELLTVHLSPITSDFTTKEADHLIKSFNQIGNVKTSDGVNLPIFEIILQDDIKIEYNRVGVNEFIKNHIIKDAVKGALVTFSYDENHDKTEWRFSFISKNSASDFFAEAEAQETNPKKYTYIFGTDEEHRTAIERLYNLEQSRFRLEDFFEAFNVEPVSKKFFEEYKQLYREFSDYIFTNFREIFEVKNEENEVERNKKTEKEIRNFVGRLLGRIVFLYFLQKKNWLGASNMEYTDGSTSFLSDLFFNDVENQEDFYSKYLCLVFFNALNTADRKNDEFILENKKNLCIPFLNGGLFEEEQEPANHRKIKFAVSQFQLLFDFFNGFNFTVYENSPEEHTVAVDPEMLGHIFENLIDYNKDTGTFYTPKEIVQYMTQESLVEYLNTHLEKDRAEIENIIKNQSTISFSDAELSQINTLLDDVKICDPAIGSGAFPMGMLQEIFNLKALINYRLGFEVWSPATVKQNIIQNSIYGVDLDEGAVEIARLRFWLSLVVDEKTPKALPNLDYKIMQGNSLLESFKGIDLSNLGKIEELNVVEQGSFNFGDDFAKEITVFDAVSFETLQKLVSDYFTYSNAKGKNKSNIKREINEIIEGKIHTKIFREKKRLQIVIDGFYKKYNITLDNNLEDFNAKSKEIKELITNKEKLNDLVSIEQELISFQSKKERPYFLWHLFFADVLDNGGFDIVIGNPPYIKEYTNKSAFDGLRDSPFYKGKMDIWYAFASLGFNILKENGTECFIAQNNWITSAGASVLRDDVLKRTEIKQFIDFGDYKVFQSAGIQTMIYLLKKRNNPSVNYHVQYSLLLNHPQNIDELTSFFKFKTKNDFSEKYIFNLISENFIGKTISFNDSQIDTILKKIESKGTFKLHDDEVAQGIVAPQDFVNKNASKILDSQIKKGSGVFVVSENELLNINSSKKEMEIVKPYYTSSQLTKYYTEQKNKHWIIYTDSSFKNVNKIDEYPNIKNHLDRFTQIITSDNKPYGLHRARDEKFFKNEKIMSLRKCTSPTFTYTDFDCYVSQSYFIIQTKKIDLKYLTAFLNSKVVAFWLVSLGKMQGQIFQIDKKPLLDVPIIISEYQEEIINLFNEISSTSSESKKEILISKIDSFFYRSINLTKDEINTIENQLERQNHL